MEIFIYNCIRITTGLLGAFLLYREVAIAHKVESYKETMQSRDFLEMERMLELSKEGIRKFSLEVMKKLSKKDYEKWIVFVNNSTDEQIKKAIGYKENWENTFDKITRQLAFLKKYLSESQLKIRRALLSIGFISIAISFAVDFYIAYLDKIK